MNREETKKLFAYIGTLYPAFTKDATSEKVDIWTDLLCDFSYEDIICSFREYARTNVTGFAPVPGNLINLIVEKRMSGILPNEAEAWSKVLDALGDSIYHAMARFKELPPLVQQAVGSAYVLSVWAQMESEDLEVVHSNFNRVYRSLAEQASRENATTGEIPSPVPEIEQRFDTSHLIEEKRPEKTEEEKAELYRWLEMQRGNVNGV